MKGADKVQVKFSKDEEKLGHTDGVYWVVVKYPDNTEKSVFFTEHEVGELKKFAKMNGYTGHIPLHNWMKEKKPQFFSSTITDNDPSGIVSKLLIKIKELFADDESGNGN